MFVKSFDDSSIYYDVLGKGPGILLLHGFGNDHTIWSSTGWIDRLSSEFTVITMDFRGCGNSTKHTDSDSYSLEAHCKDIEYVLSACNIRLPIIWGWSLGATIALHLSKSNIAKAIISAGTYFGPIFTDIYINNQLQKTSDKLNRSRLIGLSKWPTIVPHEMKTPFLVYTETIDGNVVIKIKEQQEEIQNAGGIAEVLENTDHYGLLNNVSDVNTIVIPFLRSHSR